MMNKRYKIDKVINERWAVWYMEFPKDKSKLGIWRIIDLYPGTRPTRFAIRWKVKGKEKTQEQLDEQIIAGAIKNFYRNNGGFRGTKFENNKINA